METKEIKINVPEGYEIDKDNSTFECIKFKPIKKSLLMKMWQKKLFDDTCFFINDKGNVLFVKLGIKTDKNNAINRNQLERLLAINQLLNIAEYYNRLHPKQNHYCRYFISFGKEDGYSVRPQYIKNDWLSSVIALFNNIDDAQEVINNPNFRGLLDTIYK